MDHIVFSSLLAVCKKKMPHSYNINDESTENWIEFMEPQYNGSVSSIDHETLLIQNSMCHDTYFQKEIFGYKEFNVEDLKKSLSEFVEIESVMNSGISTSKENLKYFMDRGLS